MPELIEKTESEMEGDGEAMLLGRASERTSFDAVFARESRPRQRTHSLSF